jgi:hypothetical protein
MADYFAKIKEFGKTLVKGLIPRLAPGIAEGTINQLFHEANVDVDKLTDYVEHNRSLWNELNLQQREELKALSLRLGDLSFITSELIVNSIKDDFWLVANLLVNWPEATAWLERQINELKEGVAGMDIDKNEAHN